MEKAIKLSNQCLIVFRVPGLADVLFSFKNKHSDITVDIVVHISFHSLVNMSFNYVHRDYAVF